MTRYLSIEFGLIILKFDLPEIFHINEWQCFSLFFFLLSFKYGIYTNLHIDLQLMKKDFEYTHHNWHCSPIGMDNNDDLNDSLNQYCCYLDYNTKMNSFPYHMFDFLCADHTFDLQMEFAYADDCQLKIWKKNKKSNYYNISLFVLVIVNNTKIIILLMIESIVILNHWRMTNLHIGYH